MLNLLKCTIFWSNLCKTGGGGGVSPWPCPKQFYFAEIKPDHKLTKTFYFIKIYVLAEL